MTSHVKIAGTWKDVAGIHAKVGGAWKEISEGYTRVDGSWNQFYSLAPASSFDLLETQVLDSAESSVTFSSLSTYAADYQHLQIRFVARGDRATFSQDNIDLYLNGNTTASSYFRHSLVGDGSSVTSAGNDDVSIISRLTGSGSEAGAFTAGVIDFLDAFSSDKNTTVRCLGGQESQDAGGFGGRFVFLNSVFFDSTAALSSIQLEPRFGTNFVADSRFSLYGLKVSA